ncbi:bifunctional [glutamate--ammonia ligase]-adenylyl-L-tyrosine phosphorylase/[glutamate--ammonia-ligase] adenylyltransferase [Croceicoccus ponticola]|uniref:Bifunctional [glutamate--ammonia ligase]-adenylyl-L-tyrosine phosphorylase/[glutamate--ammonia-ligase] adenylyltransferase n=1 Tax=Croceicoccus ponticola TaxID=2217664 RepID=A0A437GY05_9SPHN|nr:bifunctional [glutamate--ammonia ligase]-adenylyl-L-tyrosine phosphorylase/[glutamate--ammonia-ligase] adenylyltransferase [Croceicoccus ponticola]RVQ67571.1 bifunctional [glutamate--ammonia ligase]-adenylyl-L-tyrosine phosphorylase/[glutamate--ammonia-ligase] adenylyltransferase [Croceicoccus ponticola]
MDSQHQADWPDALQRAREHAPFLADLMDKWPDLVALLAAGLGDEALDFAKSAGKGIDDVSVALRREKQALALALAIGDLAGAFPLLKVTGELSDFASRALHAAIGEALAHRVPGAPNIGMTALALGKHGAGELNFSSDIDPILLYDPATLPRRPRDEPGEAAQIAARRIVQTMSGMTADGYVFRIDLRLRPASEVSPLAISFDGALTHYESSALAWERAAFIRAKSVAGDVEAGRAFLAAIRSFVWRKSLDFGAIAEVGSLVHRIRDVHSGPSRPGPGYDLKKGRGGIREVEFFAQIHQLIHGGRDPSLRVSGTRAALDALAAAGVVSAQDATVMGEAYDRLRVVEHRLQMVNDRQTHALPAGDALDNVAQLDGLSDGAALVTELEAICDRVSVRFDKLVEAHGGPRTPIADTIAAPVAEERLEELGFADPEAMARRIGGWESGRVKCLRSEAARNAFAAIRPQLLEAMANAPEPERAITRWEQMLAQLPSAINIFRLLEARPALLDTLARVLALSPALADALARRGDLLDTLIDNSAFTLPGSVDELVAEFGDDALDYEAALDKVRRKVGDLRFALGVQLLDNAHDPLAIAAALSRVAEAAIGVCARVAAREFAEAHGRMGDRQLVILGLGRLGGGVLTHASDLDLIYLFTGNFDGESDGRRPLGATQYFNRLAQRTTGALTVPTAEGALFEVDTRLRPSGAQGLLAVSIESFGLYQAESAWTWEHMALMRARVLYGPACAREDLRGIVASVAGASRDPAKLCEDVLSMRRDMASHKPPKGPLDIKLARGGLVDLEFLVHFHQLRHGACLEPGLGTAIGCLIDAGRLPPEMAAAHDLMTRMLVTLRLVSPDANLPPPAAKAVLAANCRAGDWDALMTALDKARAQVAGAWATTFDEELEL